MALPTEKAAIHTQEPAPLARDIERLSTALWSAVAAQDGEATRALSEELDELAHLLRAGVLPGGRGAFAERIVVLPDHVLENVARSSSLWCHLMNTAEQRHRVRVLGERGDRPPDGVLVALEAWLAAADEREIRGWFDTALVMPVLTAHPTEARRRSSLAHLTRIAAALDEVEATGRSRAARSLAAEVFALHATEHTRAHQPSPLDEVEATLDVFRRSLLDVTPRIYRTIEDRLRERFGATLRVPTFLRWGSWVGGDRDGNPNVTAVVTRSTFARQRALVLARYLEDVVLLGQGLSVSALRARSTQALPDNRSINELVAALERDRERMPEVAAHARPRTIHEPWREKLWYVQARLRATVEHRDDAYVTADEYREDLALLDRTLRAAGFQPVADHDLRDALRRVEVFGFHLASLDLRQHSSVHGRVVAELLARGGSAGYLEHDEPGRRALLVETLAHPIAPIRDRSALSAESSEALATFDVAGRARRELGSRACERYVISFAHDVSNLLEVAFLSRAAGLAPGELRPIPLLEQADDLARAGAIARDVLSEPTLRTELGDELEVMLGYSDSGKQVGHVASVVALRRAQVELAGVTRPAGVTMTVFHGRGGALGRGGGPAGEAIRAQPPAAIHGRLRVTEQGETVTARYADPEIAERDLEQTLAAVFDADRLARNPDEIDDEVLDVAARAAHAAYRELTADEDRLARYTLRATPIDFVSHLPIGSRPASRTPGLALEELRAIPWVFSWTQSRHGVPAWYGVGSAFEAIAARWGVAQTRALVERSRFLHMMVESCELALVRSDIEVAREYSHLADPDAQQLFAIIADEHARTVRALHDILGRASLLSSRPYLAASVARRNAHLDVLSHVQIEALRRRRANRGDAKCLERVIFTTIGGIAAGLQTVG